MANSRSLFAFGTDGVLPHALARIHPRWRTPHVALTVTALAGTLCVFGCGLARDFFLGVDLLVVSMLVNFLLTAAALLTFPRVNPELYRRITFLTARGSQLRIAGTAILLLGALLLVEIVQDLVSPSAWYLKSTTSWVLVMALACGLFWRFWRRERAAGRDPRQQIFGELPPE
jgi:amino acid transporter